MLTGSFENCYGIKKLDLSPINFDECNKAIIYAPNGVMKTSFAATFSNISKGTATLDRIFQDQQTRYHVVYRGIEHSFSSENDPIDLVAADNIYVIQSFEDKFEFTRDTVSDLLADEETRAEYNQIIGCFSRDIDNLLKNLRISTGLTKPQIKDHLVKDFQLPDTADWPDIFRVISESMPDFEDLNFLDDIKYSDLFNEKTLIVYSDPQFQRYISQYIDKLSGVFSDNPLLTNNFTDRSAEALSKSFRLNNPFIAGHAIKLRNGTLVNSLDEWKQIVAEQLTQIYNDQGLHEAFTNLKTLLTANKEVERIREFIVEHREIIPFLLDITALKKMVWTYCMQKLESPSFEELYSEVTAYTAQIQDIYTRASQQSERWSEVVAEFNHRFRVPFEVQIDNKANFILNDEAPKISFKYTQNNGGAQQQSDLMQEDLMLSLSQGEKRALYLMYILFDLEEIRLKCADGTAHCLVIADDIADSFDYKNKYAIIEYLYDLSKIPGIDLLVLTHNFDFYRTLGTRIQISGRNSFLVERQESGELSMKQLSYRKDYFKSVIINHIRTGVFNTDYQKELLIAGIPFFRNLSDYRRDDTDDHHYLELTCLLHYKTEPCNTERIQLSEVWSMVQEFFSSRTFQGNDEPYLDALLRIADSIVTTNTEQICLEHKLVVTIACRLKLEQFLKQKILEHTGNCEDSMRDQTRDWSERAKPYLTTTENSIVDEVNLITPENIHLNAFMYEPLIDISDWTLKQLYRDISSL